MDITEILARGWHNFLARPQGHLALRFYFQPAVAALIAIRAGIKDARERRPGYFWAALVDPAARAELLRSGLKDIRVPLIVAAVLDAIYQVITHGQIYILELLFTTLLLALVPYLLLRGPVNRIVRRFIHPADPGRPPANTGP